MTSLPAVSVIVAAYNAEPFLAECLDSVVSQQGVTLQLIVVDDGSTDGTAAIARSHPAVTYVHQENSGGCSSPRNTGMPHAVGTFVVFFDADDLMSADRLRRQAQALASAPGALAGVCNYRNFTGAMDSPQDHFDVCTGLRAALRRSAEEWVVLRGDEARELLTRENFSIASGTMYPREWVVRAGGFDLDLKASEDYDLLYRAALQGDVVVQDFIGFRRRLHDSNMSTQPARIALYRARSRDKLSALEPLVSNRRALRSHAARHYRVYARAVMARRPVEAARALLRYVALTWP